MNWLPPQRTNWPPPLEKKKRGEWSGMGGAREDSEKKRWMANKWDLSE
jgi:hypothetical protein